MIHQRGTTYREPAATRPLDRWTEPAALPAGVQPGTDWLSGFVRAARQTASPAAVRDFFRELDANDPVLSRLGWALLLAVPVFAALALFAPAAAGINPWIK